MTLPARFAVELASDHGERAVLSAAGRPDIVGGAPAEFGGHDEWWSPEHLLVSAVALCLMTTFRFFAEREALALHHCHCRAEGTVDKTAAGLAVTGVRVEVALTVATADRERARALLERAERHCLVSRSLACPVQLQADVQGV